jgi:hypothetical protein
MEKHDEKVEQPVSDTEIEETELNEEQLAEASGGIIIVGGKSAFTRQHTNYAELNPQPLPPGPDPDLYKVKILGQLGSH